MKHSAVEAERALLCRYRWRNEATDCVEIPGYSLPRDQGSPMMSYEADTFGSGRFTDRSRSLIET